jgi:RNA 3'-terminal phosphate cyclase
MNIRLRPEIEALIKQEVQRGGEACCLDAARTGSVAGSESRGDQGQDCGRICRSAAGELIAADEVLASFEEHKRAWLSERRKG